ncbi:MAG: beta-lactamase family protein [Acidobacteria bacterium]|nr:beta-lactamase family protein [Acidobacteriota bacterium]
MINILLFAICQIPLTHEGDIQAVTGDRVKDLDQALPAMMSELHINTAGFALIKSHQVQWQRQFGQQSPGVTADAKTLFNVASITKTVTAETVLRLVAQEKISLDEPMSAYWVDPDVANDPQHVKLTPRMALTHTTGFANWRYFSDDGKLKFIHEPGTTFGYSGEGIRYLTTFIEKKLGVRFEELVVSLVFEPLGMQDAFVSVQKAIFPRIAKPLDADGTFYGYYCHPSGYCRQEGDFSPTGDMVITVSDYAKFFLASMRGEGLSQELQEARNRIHVTAYDIDCKGANDVICPKSVGYGLGWNLSEWEGGRCIGHSGSDWSMVSLAYYYQNSGDGLIIFFNAPNKAGIAGMVEALKLLDPDSPKLLEYLARRDRGN